MADNAEITQKLHDVITGLSHSMGITSGRSVDGVATASVQMLAKMISKYDMTKVSIQQTQRILKEHAPDKDRFADKYNELKERNIPGLDRYLMVVSRIVADADLREMLSVPQGGGADLAGSAAAHTGAAGFFRAVEHRTPTGAPAASPAPARTPAGARDVPATPASAVLMRPNDAYSPEGAAAGGTSAGEAVPANMLQRLEAAANAPSSVAEDPALMVARKAVGGAGGGQGAAARNLIEGVSYPALPAWTHQRKYLTGEHLLAGVGARGAGRVQGQGGNALQGYPPAVQELLVMDDVLSAMMGIDGKYVWARATEDGGIKFEVDPGMDASLRALVERLLPLCEHGVVISRYVETRGRFEHGMVCHAFAAALRSLLQDWHVMLAQLEHQLRVGALSLQGMWFYCQPAIAAMQLLAALAGRAAAGHLIGAPLLNLLHEQATVMAGDRAARALLLRLLRAASVPYFRMLERWLYEGVVSDPYEEFLIVERAELRKESLSEDVLSTYWQQRYTLREHVPVFLRTKAKSILTTGKYLNSIRECGKAVSNPLAGDTIEFDEAERSFVDRINAAFEYASSELLRLLRGEVGLMSRLRSIKRYFLLDQGDFLVHFMDIAEPELKKFSATISTSKLQSLLDLALRTSTAAADPHNEELTCGLERYGIISMLLKIFHSSLSADDAGGDQGVGGGLDAGAAASSKMTGLEMFTLDYRVEWPLSLVVTRRTLAKYQLLFRHLFHCRHVERMLAATWKDHQATRPLLVPGGALARSYSLSQQMVHFMRNYIHYMTFEVMEPNWHKLEEVLVSARTVDEVIQQHEDMLDNVMKECLLFRPNILRRLETIKSICLKYATATARHLPAADMVDRADRTAAGPLYSRARREKLCAGVARAAAAPEFVAVVGELDHAFSKQLRELIVVLSSSAHLEPNLANLVGRLDFNTFFTH